MSEVNKVPSQDSNLPDNRIKEARLVEFLADFKNFKKGQKTIMHYSGAEKLAEKYKGTVKVSKLDKEAEINKAKEVAKIKED